MELLAQLEDKYKLPSGLLSAVMKQESGGNVNAVSPKGARGAFQFMPATAKQYGVDVNSLESSADGAARMYADLLKTHNGDVDKALASYNWGQGNVAKKGMEKAPKETRDYIMKIKSNMPKNSTPQNAWENDPIDEGGNAWENDPIDEPQAAQAEQSNDGLSIDNVIPNAIGLGKNLAAVSAKYGNTLISGLEKLPVNKLATKAIDAVTDGGYTNSRNQQKQDIETYNDSRKDERGYTGVKLAHDIAATAGVGNVLALGAKTPTVINALKSGGFSTGGGAAKLLSKDTLIRGAAGGAVGGAQGLMADPENADTYAGVGALLPTSVRAAGKAGQAVAGGVKNLLGAITGAGGEAISAAYQAGKKGATSYIDNVKGNVPFDDIVTQAKEGLSNMRAQRQEVYRSGMLDIQKDKSIINFAPIDNAVKNIGNMGSYKGVQINKNASGVVDDLMAKVNEWKALNPAEYHTPEGLDALKQAIGDIRDTTQFGTAARKAADGVYNAVKSEITKQAPTYAKVMKDYAEASEQLNTIQKTLSLNPNASVDTSVRKLQSVLRNNATTNYGNRGKALDALEEAGGVDLRGALAGQSLNSWMPRGMTGAIEKAGLPLLAYMNPATLALAPLTSPRLVGGAAYKLGQATGGATNSISPLLPNLLNKSVPFITSRTLANQQ